MTLEQLRVFVAVAERQHVTKAAQSLNLAQSAASAAIAALEGRYGARLFDRVGRGIELTQAGHLFLAEARAVLATVASAERTLSELGGLQRGTLSIRASQTIASYWLPPHLVTFRRLYPKIDISLGIGNTGQVAAAIHDGHAEIGLVEGAIDDPALVSTHIAEDRMVIVVPRGHVLAGERRLQPEALMGLEWVVRESGSGTRSVSKQHSIVSALPVTISEFCSSCRPTRRSAPLWRAERERPVSRRQLSKRVCEAALSHAYRLTCRCGRFTRCSIESAIAARQPAHFLLYWSAAYPNRRSWLFVAELDYRLAAACGGEAKESAESSALAPVIVKASTTMTSAAMRAFSTSATARQSSNTERPATAGTALSVDAGTEDDEVIGICIGGAPGS